MKNLLYSERADLFDPNNYIQLLATVTGNPSPDALRAAVETAFLANEAAMSRIVLAEDGTAFYEKLNTHGCKVSVSQKDWMTLLRESEKDPFRIDRGELLRVFILPSDTGTKLLILAHHLAGDGKSITYFLEDIMKAVSGEMPGYKPLQLIPPGSLPKESRLPFYLKLYADSFNRHWKRSGRRFTWDDYSDIHKAYWKERSSNVIYEAFSPEEVTLLRACARKMGVSLNSLITTAFLKADPSNGCIGMAVDARQTPNRAMSNQATGISVNHTYSVKRTFSENAVEVHRKVRKKLDTPLLNYFILQFLPLFEPTLIDSLLLHTYDLYENKTTQKLARILGYKGSKTRDLGITNLTVLDIPALYGSYELKEVMFIPPVISYARHIIGAATMPDGMKLTYHFMSDQDTAKEQAFFAEAVQTLKSCCDPS